MLTLLKIASNKLNFFKENSVSRDKWGLFAFGLAALGFFIYVKTGSFWIFAVGIASVAFLIFSKSKHIK
jgi:hypothetical protein